MTSPVLVTFPGRAGDLLWALPTVRAISESLNHPVDLQIAGEFAPLVDLLLQQPYLAGVIPDPRWDMTQGWKAPMLPERYERIVDLGYRRWPELPLPLETYDGCRSREVGLPLGPLDLRRPWITAEPWSYRPYPIAVGWTDCYFELKYGLLRLLEKSLDARYFGVLASPGSRWTTEGEELGIRWELAAQHIAASKVFLGDCSALHVLAVGLGIPVVLYEPMTARHNDIFYPLGKVGPQVTLVVGNDGEPTQDARHTAETLEKVLGRER